MLTFKTMIEMSVDSSHMYTFPFLPTIRFCLRMNNIFLSVSNAGFEVPVLYTA